MTKSLKSRVLGSGATVLGFAGALIVGQMVVGSVLHRRATGRWLAADEPEAVRKLRGVLDVDPDVVLMCDSSDWWVSPEDRDERAISEILDGLLPSIRVVGNSGKAYHMELFGECAEYAVRRDKTPRVLIVAVNLRSFTVSWRRHPGWEYADARWRLRGGRAGELVDVFAGRPLRVFKVIKDTRTGWHEYNSLPVYKGAEVVGRVKEFGD